MTMPNAAASGSFTIGGEIPVHRLGFGAMRVTGPGVWGPPRDRAEAIRSAVASLQPGDVLLIAGKGHETGQIVGDKVLPFSDHEAASAALAEHAA